MNSADGLRLFRTDEAEEIAGLLRAAHADHLAAGLNFSVGTIEAARVRWIDACEVFVLIERGQLVATFRLRQKQEAGETFGYLNDLALAVERRKTGLGAAVLAMAEQLALERGWQRLRLDTAKPAYDLVAWYSRRGYQLIGRGTGTARPTTPSCWRRR